jgi:hypothetical protein
MAIDYSTTTSITDTLKLVYGDGLKEQFAQEETLWNRLPKSNKVPAGLGYEFSVSFADPQGVGARAESGKLPDPLVGKFDKATVLPKFCYGASRLTGPALEAGKGNAAAFIDAQTNQIQGIYRSFLHDLNRQCWGDGFGKLATLSVASDTLDTNASNTWNVTCNNALGVRYLRPGMLVDFYAGSAVDQSSVASRIKWVDTANKIAVMEGNDGTYKTNHPIATHAGYTIVAEVVPNAATMVKMGTRVASFATTDTAYEMTGLLGIFDDSSLITTFQGINASTTYQWRSNILKNSGTLRELTEDLLLQAADTTRTNSGKNPEVMYMGQGMRRKLANLFLPDVRFTPQELKGGYETLTFSAGGVPIEVVVDPVGQPNSIFMATKDAVEKFELKSLGWLDYDQMMHQRSGYDEWDFVLALYGNLGTAQRNCTTLIGDLVE